MVVFDKYKAVIAYKTPFFTEIVINVSVMIILKNHFNRKVLKDKYE